ncbi:hypothetical protein ACLMAL_09780 [Nocardia sp. CWNU-33]|uniref:hypothetical protein n=1 Tax=Nocardia sp. CWNU-33 TaxID=3392117 RepID=UPI00398E9F41
MAGGTIGVATMPPAAAVPAEVAPVPPALGATAQALPLHLLPAPLACLATTGSAEFCIGIA